MDETTYSDRNVIETIKSDFVPVRVDIDERPDISERYNRGGFPTTAFLSDQGESVWGGTYMPPQDMKRVMKAVLAAKESGEIDQALDRIRMQYLDLSGSFQQRTPMISAIIDTVFEDIFAAYDVQNGGFGIEPKFPQSDVIDLLLERFIETGDKELADAINHTLDSMIDGLYDKVEGGLFRYSVTRDWKTPHYEKMLEGNAGFLRNLVRAHVVFMKSRYAETATGVATYMIGTLRDQSSEGFFGSQDADEDYYRLSYPLRRRVKQPDVIRVVYAGWNSEAASALMEAGALLKEQGWIDAGKKAFRYSQDVLWNDSKGLVRHVRDKQLYLFEDQVSFLQSLTAMIELSGTRDLIGIGNKLIEAVEREFKDPEGGYSDVMREENAIGELGTSRRSLITNSKWAKALALYGAAAHRPELTETAKTILNTFTQREIQAHGVFAASFVSAWWMLEEGAVAVEIHGVPEVDPLTVPLWLEAKEAMSSRTVVFLSDKENADAGAAEQPFAVICGARGCSKPVTSPEELKTALNGKRPSQF